LLGSKLGFTIWTGCTTTEGK
jgi:3-oxoacyl-[acyl-carrier protein] reductase